MNSIIEKQIYESNKMKIDSYSYQEKSLLRFLTCGSVDDGKSTLIGRLLHDTCQIYEDQLSILHKDSIKLGTQGNELDLALLVDGLQAEREQGITIDVAYRYFSTKKRKFIIADTPGHEQYTRNMATGASTCDVAILLIDARKGLSIQTRRHSFISTLLGIRHLIIAINKMDLIDYQELIFNNIKQDYLHFIASLHLDLDITFIPISAIKGDNIVISSSNMPWYIGQTLLSKLESIQIFNVHDQKSMRFPIQYVNRPNLDFRGYSGTTAGGALYVGQAVKILPSNITSSINRIVTFDGDKKEVFNGEAVTLVLDDEIDVSRGDVLVDANDNISSVQYAQVQVVWMNEKPLQTGQNFIIKVANKTTSAQIQSIQYQLDINQLTQFSTETLPLNGIGLVELVFDELVVLDKYIDNHITGGIIFIDKITNITVGIGMVYKPLKEIKHKLSKYSIFELELNKLIRYHFPHWGTHDLS